ITALVAIFFAAISGSGPASVAAIGGILIPALVKNGYSKETSASLVASTGSIGIIIPPSIAFIVFAVVAGDQIPISIGRLFNEVVTALVQAIRRVLVPVLLFGGIDAGYFPPTEADVVSAFHGLFVGMVIYRTNNFEKIYMILLDSGVQSAIVMFVVVTASIF